jgi:spermidine synthase
MNSPQKRPNSFLRYPDRPPRCHGVLNFPLVGWIALACVLLAVTPAFAGQLVYETTSAYHHIRVLDDANLRLLCFDDALETRVSLQDPLQGHFEYTEYFHMPWLWNTQITSVLIVGLGGGSTQRSFEHYYPNVRVETAEIDPAVIQVARSFFRFTESDRQKVQAADGRMYLRRTTAKYDLIILDAYVQGRYGSSIPQHLATKEFFELARDHLNPTNGIVAYNVIGNIRGWHANIVGAIYRTLKSVFPQVYLYPATTSQNVVLVATTAKVAADVSSLRLRATQLVQSGRITLPRFLDRVERVQWQPPANVLACPILTDDFAPVEGLADGSGAARDK